MLGIGLILAALAAHGLSSHNLIQRINRDLLHLVNVEEPLQEALLEMEINAGETARAVLNSVNDLEARHLLRAHDSEEDFERFAAQFESLTESDQERELGKQVAGLYAEFERLGDEIITLANRRSKDLMLFRKNVTEIDELIDEQIRPVIDHPDPQASQKLEAVLSMDDIIDEAFPAVESYILRPDPVYRRELLDAEHDFLGSAAQYGDTPLSPEERQWLMEINRGFADAVAAGRESGKPGWDKRQSGSQR